MISAAVSFEFGRTEVREFAFPDTARDAGLLKVECCGVCGSDWPYYQKYPGTKGPLILGHEAVGYVDRLGAEAAQRFGVREGDRVALEEYLPCGHCKYCRSSDFRLCDATDTLNIAGTIRYGSTPISVPPSLWGGYSQYQLLHPNAVLHRVPDHVPAKLATLALPLGNGVEWAYLQGRVALGETIVIQGPGQQGLASVVAAKEAGAGTIIVSGLSTPADERRLALAKKLGATHTIQADQVDVVQAVTQITNGQMADLVLDCSSGGPETIVAAVKLARKAGRVIFGGRKFRPIPEFDSDRLITQFLTIRGMRGHSFQSVELAIQIIASGKYPLEEMCTHEFSLPQVDQALHTVGGKGLPGAVHCAVNPWIA
ncbi:MAG TPA: alcohol dehydrogenase catalytic domain-containing protein [Steroidobacteraceae bacterium]|nr:alcohol dehydrogenase catalytic domain-containing protein [Steroidobacteraceae bacterium]